MMSIEWRYKGVVAEHHNVDRQPLRLRTTGTLTLAQRGPVLMTQAGAWLLETDQDLSPFAGRLIVAEGERHGFDRLRVDYAALAHDP